MVSQFTLPQAQAAPPPIYQNFSPEVVAQLERMLQQNPQQIQSLIQSQPQVQTSQASTAYGTASTGLSNIDPAVLMAQYWAMQSQNLPTQAIAPAQNIQQFAPQIQQPIQQQADSFTPEQIQSIVEYIKSSERALSTADRYIKFLELAFSDYFNLLEFSQQQHQLIEHFLYDREFVLKYIRGAWTQQPFDTALSAAISEVFLEMYDLFPKQQRNTEFTGSGNITPSAYVVPNNVPNNVPNVAPTIPPLPGNTNGQQQQSITPEQYYSALEAGQALQARAAALANPVGLYAAMLAG